MATIFQSQLIAPFQLTGVDAAIYAPPALTTAKVGRAIFCNTDTVAHQITINITTGTSTAANQVISARTVAAGETYVSPELAGAVIPAGSSLRGFADTGAKVTVTISGITIQ